MRASFRTVLLGGNFFTCKRLLYAVGGEQKILERPLRRSVFLADHLLRVPNLGGALFLARQVVSRMISLGSTVISPPCESGAERRMRRSRVSAAILPISRSGWRTVVSAGFW